MTEGHISAKGDLGSQVPPRALKFKPPFIDASIDRDGFVFWWQLLDYKFSLPSPYEFPEISSQLEDEDAARVRRYILLAEELASSTLLNHSSEVRISVKNSSKTGEQSISVDSRFADKEVTRGFAVLFRQFYSPAEHASFTMIYNIAYQMAIKQDDANRDRRTSELKAWRKAQARLRGLDLKTLVQLKMRDEGLYPDVPGASVEGENGPGSEYIISLFNYGEYIHWGDRRSELEALGRSPLEDAFSRMKFLSCVGGLSHLYLGFAVLVASAFRSQVR